MRKRYQDYYEVEVARECGLNAAAVATFLWRRLIHDPDISTGFVQRIACTEIDSHQIGLVNDSTVTQSMVEYCRRLIH